MRFSMKFKPAEKRYRMSKGLTLGVLSDFMIEHIRERTADGKDIKDRAFRRYSRSYRRYLQSIGHPTNVDLELTGRMLRSMRVKGEENGKLLKVTVYFASRRYAQLATYHQEGTPRMPARPFVGVSPSGQRKLKRLLRQRRLVIAE